MILERLTEWQEGPPGVSNSIHQCRARERLKFGVFIVGLVPIFTSCPSMERAPETSVALKKPLGRVKLSMNLRFGFAPSAACWVYFNSSIFLSSRPRSWNRSPRPIRVDCSRMWQLLIHFCPRLLVSSVSERWEKILCAFSRLIGSGDRLWLIRCCLPIEGPFEKSVDVQPIISHLGLSKLGLSYVSRRSIEISQSSSRLGLSSVCLIVGSILTKVGWLISTGDWPAGTSLSVEKWSRDALWFIRPSQCQ